MTREQFHWSALKPEPVRVLTYYKEHSKESTRCKTEHSDESINILQRTQWGKYKMQNRAQWCKTKMQVTVHCILKANEFIEKSICIILFKTWFTCLDKEIFLFIIWIIIILFYFLIMIIFHIPKLWKKLISVSFGGLVLSAKSSSLKTVPVSWVAGKFQETGPFMVSVSFPQYCDVH